MFFEVYFNSFFKASYFILVSQPLPVVLEEVIRDAHKKKYV